MVWSDNQTCSPIQAKGDLDGRKVKLAKLRGTPGLKVRVYMALIICVITLQADETWRPIQKTDGNTFLILFQVN